MVSTPLSPPSPSCEFNSTTTVLLLLLWITHESLHAIKQKKKDKTMLYVCNFFWLFNGDCVLSFLFFILRNINLQGLFIAKGILVKEQQWFNLTHSWENKRVHTFSRGISSKVNAVAWLEKWVECSLMVNPRSRHTKDFMVNPRSYQSRVIPKTLMVNPRSRHTKDFKNGTWCHLA